MPRLSVVVAAWHGADALARCLAALYAGGAADDAEIIVARNWNGGASAELAARYPDVQQLPLDATATVPRLRAAGLARARGEIVAFLEDHAAVAPRWRAALLRAHARGAAAVGGPVANEPGSSPLEWAVYFYDYGRYAPPCPAGSATQLSGINSSYRRDVLDALGETIAAGVHEDVLQAAVRARGHELVLEPEALVVQRGHHTAVGATTQAFHLARGYAARRGAAMSPGARVARAVGSVVLPVVMLGRLARGCAGKRELRKPLARAFPWLVTLVGFWSLGEAVGYTAGAGRSDEHWR